MTKIAWLAVLVIMAVIYKYTYDTHSARYEALFLWMAIFGGMMIAHIIDLLERKK